MNAIIIYWSGTGNTKKVAETIHETLRNHSVNSLLKRVEEAKDEDLYNYDLIFLGSPSHTWIPPAPVQKYITEKLEYYRKRGDVKLCAPKIPGKKGISFVTYSGPHTGISEAIPAGKYLGQFLEHLGFDIVAEWYIVGELYGSEENSTKGKMGDTRGRPNQEDLENVRRDVIKLLNKCN
jgi:hypothetical protein